MRYHAPNPRLMIRIDRALLDSRLALAVGQVPSERLRLDLAFDLTSPGGRTWRSLVDTVGGVVSGAVNSLPGIKLDDNSQVDPTRIAVDPKITIDAR